MRISDWSSDVCSSDLRSLTSQHLSSSFQLRDTLTQGFDAVGGEAHSASGRVALCWFNAGHLIAVPVRRMFPQPLYQFIIGHWLPFRWALYSPHQSSRATVGQIVIRSEEHTSELQSLMRISYAVFCLKKNINYNTT